MFKSLTLAALTAASVVSALSCSDKNIKVQSDGDAEALSDCGVIRGNVLLGTGVNRADLTGVRSIGGDLTCIGCQNATSIVAPDLQTIGGAFKLTGMINLAELRMVKLSKCGSLEFKTLPNLMSMTLGPVNQADNVLITDTVLSDLSALDLVEVSNFDVNNNRYLKEINMGIETVEEAFSVTYNAKSVSVNLPNMVWANNLTFRDVGELKMPSLEAVNGSFGMINCTFDSIKFENLTTVGQSLAIVSDDSCTKIDFPLLKSVVGGFQISNNSMLTTVDGLGSLQSVGGAIDFNGDMKTVKIPKVKDVRGGFNLQTTAEKFDCDPFQKLKDSGEIQGTYTCKFALSESQVGGLGSDKGGGSSGSKSSNAGNVVISGTTLLGCALFSLFYIL